MSSVQVQVSKHMPFLLLDAVVSGSVSPSTTTVTLVTQSGNVNCNVKSVSCSAPSDLQYKCDIVCTPQVTSPVNVSKITVVVKDSANQELINATWDCSLSNVSSDMSISISQSINITT